MCDGAVCVFQGSLEWHLDETIGDFVSLRGFLKCHQKSLPQWPSETVFHPRLLPKSYFIKSQWVLVLFFSFSFFPPPPLSASLALSLSFGRAPASLFMCWRNSCLVQGVRLGQAGWLQALQASKHWAHCLKHTLALAHTQCMHSPPRRRTSHPVMSIYTHFKSVTGKSGQLSSSGFYVAESDVWNWGSSTRSVAASSKNTPQRFSRFRIKLHNEPEHLW